MRWRAIKEALYCGITSQNATGTAKKEEEQQEAVGGSRRAAIVATA